MQRLVKRVSVNLYSKCTKALPFEIFSIYYAIGTQSSLQA